MNGQWQRSWSLLVLVLVSVLGVGHPSDLAGAEGRTYRVQGKVVAINLRDMPNIIVVKTPITLKDEMTVGAVIDAHTKIVRGGKPVALHTIKVGEIVSLTYTKSRDGLFARAVQAR
ncbi:MAG TPA: hypothetical protein VH681_09425 [Nitrospiraceae bacterium]|jgi:hypothetical protein